MSYVRLSTVLNGSLYWVGLGEPSGVDRCRRILLEKDVRKAALIEFSPFDETDDDRGYVEFPEIRFLDPGLMRPIMGNHDLSALGTVAYTLPSIPSDICWRRIQTSSGGYKLQIDSDHTHAVVVSHTVGLRRKMQPYLLIGDQTLREDSAAVFEFVYADFETLLELQEEYDGNLMCACCGYNYITNGPGETDPSTGTFKEPCAGCHIAFATKMVAWIEEWHAYAAEDAAERLERRISDFKKSGGRE